ncbi:hypothetical protein KCU98_g1154, partial [Aureobasidium melanogenum]
MHFMFEKPGYDHLITALYIKGSEFETSDAVFGVKESLIVPLGQATDEHAAKYGVRQGSKILEYDFVLITDQESRDLRESNALRAMRLQGLQMKLWQGLPVPDVD